MIYSESQWHVLYGGPVKNVCKVEFSDLGDLHIVGFFPNYREAYEEWRIHASKDVPNFKYFISPVGRIIDPGQVIVDISE